jgi:tetratricopeptide (TPR) repeat protein
VAVAVSAGSRPNGPDPFVSTVTQVAVDSPRAAPGPADIPSGAPPDPGGIEGAQAPGGGNGPAAGGPEPAASGAPAAAQTWSQSPEQEAQAAAVSAAPAPGPFLPAVPGYTILTELGRGGMGVVYRARQHGLNREVALKMVLHAQHAGSDQLARFRNEIEAVARLRHPNIVQVYQVGDQEGRPYFSMELVEGGTLDKHLAGVPKPPAEAARMVETLALAIEAAHRQHVIHRDLKPGNVLLSDDGVPKVTDFGLAKHVDDESWKTKSGVIMGTPSYMAPEQAAGKGGLIGPATDVYALGAILYELLTGRPPFRAPTMVETLDQVRHQEPVSPRQLQPKTPRDLETICLKCLQKEPPKRYSSAEALAADLRRYLEGKPILARPVSAWERGIKWAKRRPAVAALVVMSAVAVLGLGAFYFERLSRQEAMARDRKKKEQEYNNELFMAQAARAEGNFDVASVNLRRAAELEREIVSSDPDFHGEAERLREQVQQEQAQRRIVQAANAKYDRFKHLRDTALFHATLSLGDGLEVNLKDTRKFATEALASFGIDSTFGTLPKVDECLKTHESDIRERCYELLLVLAEAEAQPLPREPWPEIRAKAERALRVLDVAWRFPEFRGKTRAYHLRRALYLEQKDEQEKAAAERKRADQIQPSLAFDSYLVGDSQYKQGMIPEAMLSFEQAFEKDSGFFWAQYFLAVCYLREGEAAQAKHLLTNCLKEHGNLVWIYLMRGFAHGQLDEFEAAEADFAKALDLKPPEDARYVLHANRGVMRIRQVTKEAVEKGIEDFKEAIRLKPKEYQAYASLAQVYESQGRLDLAVPYLDQAIARAVKQKVNAALLYRSRARLDEQMGSLEKALGDLERTIREDWADDSPEGVTDVARDYADKGRLLSRMRLYDQALGAHEKALALRPRLAAAHLGRAQALRHLQMYPESVNAYGEYFKDNARPVPGAYLGRALARSRLNDWSGAVEDYTLALNAGDGSARVHTLRGWAYLAGSSPALALNDFEEAVRLDPRSADAYTGRGYAQVKLGRYDLAVGDADRAVDLVAPKGKVVPDPAPGSSAVLLLNAARIFAQAAARVSADPRLWSVPKLRQARLLGYQRRAIALIVQVLDAVPPAERPAFWQEHVARDGALDSLRDTTTFRRLQGAYGGQGGRIARQGAGAMTAGEPAQ